MARRLAGPETIVLPGSSHEARSGAPEWYACFQRFHVLFHFLFKVLFIFPSRYLFAIGLQRIFSFRRILPPVLCCSPKQHDSLEADLMTEMRPGHLRGYYPLWPAVSTTSYTQRPVGTRSSRPQFPHARHGDFRIELSPLHSPLLRGSLLVSFPPLNNMFKFSGSSYLSSALVLA